MKTSLKKQEKTLQSKLTETSEQRASFLLILAELKYLQGDRQQAVSLVHEAIEAPWAQGQMLEIARKLTDNSVRFCDIAPVLQFLHEKKQDELAKYDVLKQLEAILQLHLTTATTPECESARQRVVALKDSTTVIEQKRFLLRHLLRMDRAKITDELKQELCNEYEETSLEGPLGPDDKIALLRARSEIEHTPQLMLLLMEKTRELLQSVTDDQQRAEINLVRGQLNQGLGRKIEAMRSYEAGLRYVQWVDSDIRVQLTARLGLLYGQLGLFRQAFREIETGLHLSNVTKNEALDFRFVQFQLYKQLNRHLQARQIGQIIIKSDLSPIDTSVFLLEYAQLLLGTSDLESALQYCAEIRPEHLSPQQHSDLHYLFYQLRLKADRKEDALPHLQQAIELCPNDRVRLQRKVLLGRLYKELGHLEKGVETLKAVTAESAETEEAHAAVKDLKEIREELESPQLDEVITLTRKKQLLDDLSEEIGERSLFDRLQQGLRKTRDTFVSKLEQIIKSGAISEDVFDEVEETLILADVGYETTNLITTRLRNAYRADKIKTASEIKPFLIAEISSILSKYQGVLTTPPEPPLVIMMIGVNGVGKTTTIAKLAYSLHQQNKSVLLAAADTFRAGAIEQISEWGNRLNIDVIKHKSGSDPSAVAYDAVHAAKARNKDVLIIDTAGRLHTKVNLMEELKKIRRIINRELPQAPHEILLVLDATNGQNAISQAKIFKQDLDVSGIILTKLDGTAKGGIIISIANELDIPVKFIGVGEKMYDLRPFKAQEFVEALFGLEQ